MFFGKKDTKKSVEPSAPTAQELAFKLACMEMRVLGLEQGVVELCHALRAHLDRIDANTKALDNNMHRLAELTIRPPKDLLNGNNESN